MTDWREHNGGPQPEEMPDTQGSIDTVAEAAILHRGIRFGVLAAARSIFHEDDLREILSIDTLEVLKEFRDEQ